MRSNPRKPRSLGASPGGSSSIGMELTEFVERSIGMVDVGRLHIRRKTSSRTIRYAVFVSGSSARPGGWGRTPQGHRLTVQGEAGRGMM